MKASLLFAMSALSLTLTAAQVRADDTETHTTIERKESSVNVVPPPMHESTTTTTTRTEETYTGTVKRLSPSRTVLMMNGHEYDISGPYAPQISTQVDKEVTFSGRLDEPDRKVEITRYERIDR